MANYPKHCRGVAPLLLAEPDPLLSPPLPCLCVQVSAALNPENEAAKAFQECCLIRHPRHGEWAFGFVTGKTMLQVSGEWWGLMMMWQMYHWGLGGLSYSGTHSSVAQRSERLVSR